MSGSRDGGGGGSCPYCSDGFADTRGSRARAGTQARCCDEEGTPQAPPAVPKPVARKRAGRKRTAVGMPDHAPPLQVDRIQECTREAHERPVAAAWAGSAASALRPATGSRAYGAGYIVLAPEDRAGRKRRRDTPDPLGKGGHRREAARTCALRARPSLL